MKRVLTLATVLTCLAAAAAALAGKEIGPVPADAAAAMADRDYGEAVDELLDAVADKVPEADYLLYLVGRARFLMKRHDRAIKTFERIIKRPESPWRRKAIFGMADAMAAQRGFDRAAELYEREVRALLSLQRREEVAGEYLRFATKYFEPEEPDKPDFSKAETFFKLALEVGLTEARAEEVSYRIGRCRFERQDWNGAIQALQNMKQQYPKGRLSAEAALFLGRARLKTGDRAGARAAFEDLAADFAGSGFAPQALFEIGDTYGLPNASGADLDLGVKALKTFVDTHPKHELAATARFRIAESFFNAGRTEEAAQAFSGFIDAHRATELDELARARFLLGECHRRRKNYPAAVKAWRDFLRHHPTHGDWSAAQQRIMQVDFDAAEDARQAEKYGEAKKLYTRFLERYPLSLKNPAAMYALGKLEFDQEHHEAAVREWRKLVSKYPSSAEASQAHLEIAETLDRKLQRSEEALKEYEKVQGPKYSEARQRAREMREKSLTVITERAFTTADKPRIKVRSRNTETLTYRVYRIDLETYFRAYHAVEQIEDLDIALIAPDRKWEEQVPGYAKYREVEREVELELQGGGAWVVNVSAKTLEATTLVLVSDLQVVLKASAEEVLVYAEDVRREKPFSGVSVVITDGEKPVFEGKTGGDGIFKKQAKADEIGEPDRLAAFAVAGGKHYAASGLDIGGASVGQALQPSALLFTDRPAYRPGAKVGVKGFLREVTNGRHGFQRGRAYTLRISDPGGAVLMEQEVKLDRFGGLEAGYVLPDTATVGTYHINLSREDGPSFSGNFLVAEYTLPRFDLKVEFDRKVYFRGERLTGAISVKHYYGEPAVGRQVTYRLHGGEVKSGTADEEGKIKFDFDSRRFLTTQTLTVRADLTAEGLTANGTTWIAAAAFRAGLSSPRDVYLAGEEFSATVSAHNVLGDPQQAEFAVQAYRVTTGTDGATGEALVAERKVSTDKDGKGQASFRFDEGGSFRLRARATDRAGNPVTASLDVFVSGKDDEVKLRLFTERTEYEAGETAKITVHSRVEKPNLVLVTYEAEGVLGHRLITVRPGTSSLEVKMTEDLAPNFNLALALVDGNDFHAAEREFSVDRGLNIAVASVKEKYRTRDEAEVTLKVTDRLGRPVEAGVALAAVDEALFALYPDSLSDIGDVFYGQEREIGVETSSSCGFKYEPETREVSEELLKEEARAEMEKKIGAKRKARVMAPKPSIAAMEMMDDEMGVGGLGLSGSGSGGGGMGYGSGMGKIGVSKGRAMVMGKAGRMVQARQFFSETAYWNPSVVTGKDGTAKVSFKLPDSTTTFRLTARGASTGTLFGQGRGKLRVMEPFSLDVKAPVAAVAGDRVSPLALVRNHTGEDLQAEVRVEGEAAKRVPVKAGRDAEVQLPEMEIPDRAGVDRIPLPVEVRATAGPHADAIKRSMLVQAKGHEVRAGKAGPLASDSFIEIALPEGREYIDRRLEIYVGPTPERSLLDAVANAGEGSPWCQAQTADAVLSAAAGVRYLEAIGKGGGPTSRDLVSRLEGLTANLAHSQSSDGSWGYAGRHGKGDPYISASVTRALVLARKAGARVPQPALDRAFTYLEGQYRSSHDPAKLAILRARAAAGKANFQHLNRLYRLRNSLRPHLLGPLSLALWDAGRQKMAADTAKPLAGWVVAMGDDRPPLEAWYSDRTAALAVAVEALARTDPGGASTRAGAEALLKRRWGPGWGSTRATAAAVEALAVYHGKATRAADNYRVELLVNGKPVGDLRVQGARGPFRLVAPQGALAQGAQRIDFKLKGRGSFSYSAVLTGVARGFAKPDDDAPIKIKRRFEPAPLSYKGKEIPRGFGVLSGSYTTWRNTVSQVPAGGSVRATLEFSRRSGRKERGYLIVEETLPGGMVVLQPSIKGRKLHHEIGDGKITFYLGDDQYYGSITYDLLATVPGQYAVPPALLRSASDPIFDNASEAHSLQVLPRGGESQDEYRYTPDELYHLGQRYFDDGRKADAAEFLTQLIDGYKLRDRYFKEVARMLLYAALERKDAPAVVKYFEILKEKYPTLVIDFDDIVEIGKAYRDIGEHERALQVFKAAVEASFLVEARVGGALKGQGEFWASADFTQRLIAEYPDLPVVRNSLYGLGQMLYRHATEAPTTPDPEAVKKKLTRVDFLDAAVGVFNEFLVRYPEDPVADEASFSLASAYLDAAEYKDVVSLGKRYKKRYPRSRYLSAAEYIMAFAHFAREEYRRSLDLCRKVATAMYPDGEDGEEESPHQELARYIMGQIFHSMGKADKAIAEYGKVREMFPDAEEAIRAFERIELSLPEVTDVPLKGRARVEVSYRNVPEIKIFVYRVDLMKLYVLQKDLENITGVNLSGIRPFFEKSVRLSGGRDHRAHKQAVDLPLRKPGAYLVVAKGDAAAASGMVVRSDLKLEVQEDPASGRVRVNLLDRRNRVVPKAYVKVVGASDGEFKSEYTDLRGVVTFDEVEGRVTVIAKEQDQYAFYRGKIDLQGDYEEEDAFELQEVGGPQFKQRALEDLNEMNRAIQQQNIDFLEQNIFDNEQQGVEVQMAK